jgi:CheY-like chemotaxis protein
LVEKMGGEIGVESKAGAGSTFSFTARLGKAAAAPVEAAAPGPPRTAAAAMPGGMTERRVRILLAEDNVINQAVARKNFERLGTSADVAANGVEALKALRSSHYDLVFMDVEMPEMDGLQATRLIRSGAVGEEASKIPIVAMTAHAMQGDRERFLGAGMTDYITKPIDPRSLAEAIDRWAPSLKKAAPAAQ